MTSRLAELLARLPQSAMVMPLAVLLAVMMVGINEVSYGAAGTRLEELVQMGRARLQIYNVLRRITEAESGKRGYMLVGTPEYLANYHDAHADVQTSLQLLHHIYARVGDDETRAQLKVLEEKAAAKLSEMREVLQLIDRGERDKALEVVRSGIGRDLMEQLRTASIAMVDHQNRQIERGLRSINDTLMLNRVAIGVMTALSLLVVVLLLRQGRALQQAQLLRQSMVAAERDRLELEVTRRTRELTELARHLQTAREDERARLARELHDELGALLTAAKLDVARIRPKLQQGAPDLLPRLTHLTETLNSGIALKRRIIEDLRPSTLSSLGLVPALEILCTEFADRSGLKVHAELAPVRLSAEADLTVYRVVQEALTNVAKYAQASEVWVTMRAEEGHARVQVRDNGVGFDPRQTRVGSHGLVGMRFRLQASGGLLAVNSHPGSGTTLDAELPERPADEPAVEAGGTEGA